MSLDPRPRSVNKKLLFWDAAKNNQNPNSVSRAIMAFREIESVGKNQFHCVL